MYEATPKTSYTLLDGTLAEVVRHDEVNGRPSWSFAGDDPYRYANMITRDDLYVHKHHVADYRYLVEVLPPPKSAGPENGIPAQNVAAMKPANPKQAFGDKKRPVHVVPPALMLGASKAFGEGAVKYGAYNWRETNVESMTYIGALLRHAFAYLDGEDVDPESTTGKLHLEGMAACIGILLDGTYGGFLIDNRPPKGPAPELTRMPK